MLAPKVVKFEYVRSLHLLVKEAGSRSLIYLGITSCITDSAIALVLELFLIVVEVNLYPAFGTTGTQEDTGLALQVEVKVFITPVVFVIHR